MGTIGAPPPPRSAPSLGTPPQDSMVPGLGRAGRATILQVPSHPSVTNMSTREAAVRPILASTAPVVSLLSSCVPVDRLSPTCGDISPPESGIQKGGSLLSQSHKETPTWSREAARLWSILGQFLASEHRRDRSDGDVLMLVSSKPRTASHSGRRPLHSPLHPSLSEPVSDRSLAFSLAFL